MENCTVFVDGIAGIDKIRLEIPTSTSINELKEQIRARLPSSTLSRVGIATTGGMSINKFKTLDELYRAITHDANDHLEAKYISLQLTVCLCGGKGGFGELLKQRGRDISKKGKATRQSKSNDLYKTLDGRKVKTIKRLQQLEERLDSLDETKKQKLKEKREKLEKVLNMDLEKNVKFEDTKYLDDIDEQIEEIRNFLSLDLESSQTDGSEDEEDSGSEDSSDDEKQESSSKSMCKFAGFFSEEEELEPTASKKPKK